jgi:hypothetical protein
MREINFESISSRNGGQDEAFEELCCQLGRRELGVPEGGEFHRYRGAGGDGGVECIWSLPGMREWGWQAKYIFDFDRALTDLDESFRTAITTHPRLVRYIMCVPFDLTGTTGRGKGQQERFDEKREEWRKVACAEGVVVDIELRTASSLAGELIARDPSGGMIEYFFNEKILTEEWFRGRLQEAILTAGPRYSSELRVETPLTDAFEALGETPEWAARLKQTEAEFFSHVKEVSEAVERTTDTGWSAAFPDLLRPTGRHVVTGLQRVREAFRSLVGSSGKGRVRRLRDELNQAIPPLRELLNALRAELEREHGKGSADSASFRQFSAEYETSFPAANVDRVQASVTFFEKLSTWAESPSTGVYDEMVMLLLGAAGAGKTHGICDAAVGRDQRGLRTIVLFGEHLRNEAEPWNVIQRLLQFDSSMTADRILSALNAVGEAAGHHLIVCVDGLNETRPRSFWRSHLLAFIHRFAQYPFLRLCVSCRSTYESLVIPEGHPFHPVRHQGFAGVEFDACRAFFEFYHLEPPVAPLLHPEFSNPLFLKLVCQALQSAGAKRMPDGWHGINTAILAFLSATNRAYALEHEGDERERAPERALKAFVTAAEQRSAVFLDWSQAQAACGEVNASDPGALLAWLIREGLLSADANPGTDDPDAPEIVRVAFERLGDHLLAAKLIEQVDPAAVGDAFAAGGALHFAVASAEAIAAHRGLVEALSIQLPEHKKISRELVRWPRGGGGEPARQVYSRSKTNRAVHVRSSLRLVGSR